jgi:hypothetical protein
MVQIEGQKYLINDATGQVHVVPAKPKKVSNKARSLSPVDLSRDSFEETHVTPTHPFKKRVVATSSTYDLSENNESESDEEVVSYVPSRKKKRKPSRVSQSEVQALLDASQEDHDNRREAYHHEEHDNDRGGACHDEHEEHEEPQTGHSGEKSDGYSSVSEGSETDLGEE